MAVAPALVINAHHARHRILAQVALERTQGQPGAAIGVQPVACVIEVLPPQAHQIVILDLVQIEFPPGGALGSFDAGEVRAHWNFSYAGEGK